MINFRRFYGNFISDKIISDILIIEASNLSARFHLSTLSIQYFGKFCIICEELNINYRRSESSTIPVFFSSSFHRKIPTIIVSVSNSFTRNFRSISPLVGETIRKLDPQIVVYSEEEETRRMQGAVTTERLLSAGPVLELPWDIFRWFPGSMTSNVSLPLCFPARPAARKRFLFPAVVCAP